MALTLPAGLPIPILYTTAFSLGPEDMRLFYSFDKQLFGIFNMYEESGNRRMWLFSFATGKIHKLSLNYRENDEPEKEKNWCPLVGPDSLYFVYNYKNLQIVNCTDFEKDCELVFGKFSASPEYLRGGTPFVRLGLSDYYFSFSYSHLDYFKDSKLKVCSVYRPSLTIIKADDFDNLNTFKVVYTSEPFDFFNQLFLHPVTELYSLENLGICKVSHILLISSIAKVDYERDETDLTVSANDKHVLAVKVSGLIEYVKDVIQAYEDSSLKPVRNCAERLAIRYYMKNYPGSLGLPIETSKLKNRPGKELYYDQVFNYES